MEQATFYGKSGKTRENHGKSENFSYILEKSRFS